jgi:hypothetical protein
MLPDFAGVFCLILFACLAAFGGKKALADGDTLWHIRAGAVMLERGEILSRDVFSHTAFDQPWIAHEWLAEIIMAVLHAWGGLPAVVLFHFLLVALTFWLLFKIALRYAGEWVAFFCLAVAFLFSYTHLLARPHIFTWFFGVLTLYLLHVGGRRLFLLPLLMIPWVNLHGGFLLGLVLQGLFLAGHALEGWSQTASPKLRNLARQNRIPLQVILLSLLASGINPFGFDLLLFPLQVASPVFVAGIGEWRPPDLQELWFFRDYLLFLVFLLLVRKQRISWTNGLLLLFFLNWALTYVRHVSLAGIFLVPFLAEALKPYADRLREILSPYRREGSQLQLSSVTGPLATLALFLVLTVFSSRNGESWAALFPLPEDYSPQAIEFLRHNLPAGKMFNEYSWGDYLLYALEPPPKVFIDGRADMYGEKIFGDYGKIAAVEEECEELLLAYGIDWIVFPPSRTLVRYLKATGNWEEVYLDDQTSILVRKRS